MMESPPPHTRVYVEAVLNGHFEVFKMPMTCRHCDPAPCMAACIPQAMYRTAEGVVINVGGKHACIACGMCVMMCPFGMIARAPALDGKVMAPSAICALIDPYRPVQTPVRPGRSFSWKATNLPPIEIARQRHPVRCESLREPP
jgi:Fe-S-cluster-containing hydrogenase component 2